MKRKLAQLVFGGWFNTLLVGLLGIYVARVLGPDDKGVLSLAAGSAAIVSTFFHCGVPHAAAYFARSRPGTLSRILAFIDWTLAGTLALSVPMAFMGADAFARLFLDGSPVDAPLMVAIVLTIVAGSANGMLLPLIVARGGARESVISSNLGTFLTIALTLVVLHLSGRRVTAVLFAACAGQVFSAVLARLQLRRFRDAYPTPGALTVSEFFAYGMKVQLGHLASLFFKRLDLFFIGYFLTPAAVGHYSVGLSLRDIAQTVSRSVTGLIAAELADPEKRGDGRGRRLLRKGMGINLAFSAAATVAAFALFPTVIPLVYGDAYREGAFPSAIIMASAIPLSLGVLISSAVGSLGKPLIMSLGHVAAASASASATWHFTRRYGLDGAATAAVAGCLALLIIHSILLAIVLRRPSLAGRGKKDGVAFE